MWCPKRAEEQGCVGFGNPADTGILSSKRVVGDYAHHRVGPWSACGICGGGLELPRFRGELIAFGSDLGSGSELIVRR